MMTPVLSLEEAVADPHLRSRHMVQEVTHPTLGKTVQVGSPFKLSDTPPRLSPGAPLAGEHTAEILRSLNYDDAAIQALMHTGIVE